VTIAAQVGWALLAGIIMLVAVVRVVRVPAECWTYRQWSKAGAVLLALWSYDLRPETLPVGAAVVIWHTHQQARRRAARPDPPGVSFADGAPEDTEERPR
jgi:hypothetical protein